MAEACQFCGSQEHQPVSEKDRHGGYLDTVICMGCGIVTNDPIPSDEALADFYKTDYRKDYKGAAEPRMRQVWRNFGRIRDHIETYRDIYQDRKKCLDLGSGSGEFMFLARALGIDCVGVEPSVDYSAYCRDRLGLEVKTQTLEETEFKPKSFDLIRLSHVLEHMREPVRSLKVLHKWLADDGVLYVEVPNIAAEADLKMRGRLFHFGHIFNFDPFTLRLAAGLAGFEELPETKERGAGTTGVFLRKVKRSGHDLALGPANATKLKRALERHYERTIPDPPQGSAVGRFFAMLAMRAREVIAARKYSSYRQIADHFAGLVTRGAGSS